MKKFADTPFLPTEVEIEAISETEAKISAYPFENGYAITKIKEKGYEHPPTTCKL